MDMEMNDTGRVIFVRDAEGELLVVKPGQPMPASAPPPPGKDEEPGAPEPKKQKLEKCDSTRTQIPLLLAAARNGDDIAMRTVCKADEEAVHSQDHLQRTALHLAAHAGHVSTVELLLAFGARHSPLACDSITPLHFAAQNGHVEVCNALLNAGAKVNARGTKRNDTPLHLCAFRGHLECIEFLLSKKADARLKNKAQKTPADVAANDEIRQVLISALATGTESGQKTKDDGGRGCGPGAGLPACAAEEQDEC
jgi:ankyrin repeat protein